MTLSPIARYLDRFFDKLDVPFYGAVLDVGCGDGRISARLSTVAESVVAVDASPNPAWESLEGRNLSFTTGDAEALAFADDRFDCVVAINMLHHTKHPEVALREMRRVCKPGGTLVIVEPNRYNPLGYVHLTLMGDHQHFPTARFRAMLTQTLGTYDMRRFECHCYPVPAPVLTALERIEDVLTGVPAWQPFVFYNAAVAIK